MYLLHVAFLYLMFIVDVVIVCKGLYVQFTAGYTPALRNNISAV
jgi:hypothetical protein